MAPAAIPLILLVLLDLVLERFPNHPPKRGRLSLVPVVVQASVSAPRDSAPQLMTARMPTVGSRCEHSNLSRCRLANRHAAEQDEKRCAGHVVAPPERG
jgi:hypothetical protein